MILITKQTLQLNLHEKTAQNIYTHSKLPKQVTPITEQTL